MCLQSVWRWLEYIFGYTPEEGCNQTENKTSY